MWSGINIARIPRVFMFSVVWVDKWHGRKVVSHHIILFFVEKVWRKTTWITIDEITTDHSRFFYWFFPTAHFRSKNNVSKLGSGWKSRGSAVCCCCDMCRPVCRNKKKSATTGMVRLYPQRDITPNRSYNRGGGKVKGGWEPGSKPTLVTWFRCSGGLLDVTVLQTTWP